MAFSFHIQPLGDAAFTLFFANVIDENANQHIIKLSHHFRTNSAGKLKDIVPAYASITLHYDPEKIWPLCDPEQTASAYMLGWINDQMLKAVTPSHLNKRVFHVPVCYSEKFGPDLALLASEKSLRIEEVVGLHISRAYRVYMIGFLPGFPYMGLVDARIAMPRKKQPALHIEAGSVGIAGLQTGIYPVKSPGGWHIIGRTPLTLFDKDAQDPVLFSPGDEVSFFQISENEFENY